MFIARASACPASRMYQFGDELHAVGIRVHGEDDVSRCRMRIVSSSLRLTSW